VAYRAWKGHRRKMLKKSNAKLTWGCFLRAL
jgi:hypothetical protein